MFMISFFISKCMNSGNDPIDWKQRYQLEVPTMQQTIFRLRQENMQLLYELQQQQQRYNILNEQYIFLHSHVEEVEQSQQWNQGELAKMQAKIQLMEGGNGAPISDKYRLTNRATQIAPRQDTQRVSSRSRTLKNDSVKRSDQIPGHMGKRSFRKTEKSSGNLNDSSNNSRITWKDSNDPAFASPGITNRHQTIHYQMPLQSVNTPSILKQIPPSSSKSRVPVGHRKSLPAGPGATSPSSKKPITTSKKRTSGNNIASILQGLQDPLTVNDSGSIGTIGTIGNVTFH